MGIEDVVYIDNGILLRHKHNDIIMPFVAILMDLEIIILNGVSHTLKDKYMVSLICGI